MELSFLANNKDAIPIIAQWYFDEWGYLTEENSIAKVKQNLQAYLNIDKIPLMIIAKSGKEILGTAQLKYREMSIYPEKEHWLGGGEGVSYVTAPVLIGLIGGRVGAGVGWIAGHDTIYKFEPQDSVNIK